MRRSLSRRAKTLLSWSATSSRVTERLPPKSSSAASTRAIPARARRSRSVSGSAATTAPSRRTTTAASICDEISIRSASAAASAFNIVYDRPNRSFFHGKYLATLFMAGSIVALATGLVIGGFGYDLLQRFAGGVIANGVVAYSLSAFISTLSIFLFLVLAYARLTNEALSLRQGWPGALLAAVLRP